MEPDMESKEVDSIQAALDVSDALLNSTELPDGLRLQVQKLAGILAQMAVAQSAESDVMSVTKVPPVAPTQAEVANEKYSVDDRAKLDVIEKSLGRLSPAELEAKLFAIQNADPQVARDVETEEKQALLLSCIREKRQISPYNSRAHERFMQLSIDAARAFHATSQPMTASTPGTSLRSEPNGPQDPVMQPQTLLSIGQKFAELQAPSIVDMISAHSFRK